MGLCADGPNVVLDPGGIHYGEVEPSDVDELVANIEGGPVVDRLLRPIDRMELRMAMWMTDADFE